MIAGRRLHVTFICYGNICRSPMAANMFAHQIRERGLEERVRVSSAGTHGHKHAGQGAHRDTVRVLQEHGYPTGHSATQVDLGHAAADLVVAMDRTNVLFLKRAWPRLDTGRFHLLRTFDAEFSGSAPDIPNPWASGTTTFEACFDTIKSALPGLHRWLAV